MEWGYSVDIDPLETLKIRYAMVLRDNKKLQAEVERLYEINQGCESEARLYDDLLRRCRVENAQLRKVADAARALVPSEMYQCTRHLYALKHTLDEYDKAKEGQE